VIAAKILNLLLFGRSPPLLKTEILDLIFFPFDLKYRQKPEGFLAVFPLAVFDLRYYFLLKIIFIKKNIFCRFLSDLDKFYLVFWAASMNC